MHKVLKSERRFTITYQAVEEKLYHPENGDYTALGVSVFQDFGGAKELIIHIPDVFLKREETENFVEICNRLELDIVHFCDVIEDVVS